MREAVRELAVVRQQQRARRVHVEPPDRDDALRQVDERDDRRPPLRIGDRRYDTARLVQQHVGQSLPHHVLPVDLHPVARSDERIQLTGLPVDRHAPGLDQLVGPAARRDAGPREIGVQTHARYCPPMPHYVTLMRWTSQGIAGLPAWRERIEEGERIIDETGGKLVGVFVTMGRYDVVEIFEAPDDELAVEILMKLQRFGAEHTETLRAFTREEAEEIIRRL